MIIVILNYNVIVFRSCVEDDEDDGTGENFDEELSDNASLDGEVLIIIGQILFIRQMKINLSLNFTLFKFKNKDYVCKQKNSQ